MEVAEKFLNVTYNICYLFRNDTSYFSYSAGGVELLTRQGKIKVDNTLEARLKMVAHNNLPQMRNALFGANQNRKFFD